MAEETDVIMKMNELKSELEFSIDKLRTEIDGEALIEEPDFSSESDKTLDVKLKNKLTIESEIEALLESDFYLLPDDAQTLLSLAKEGAVATKDQQRRNLNYYNEKVESLKKEKSELKHMLDQASRVDKKLDEIIKNRPDTEVMAPLIWRYNIAGEMFKELRTELHDLIEDHFPQQDTVKSMNDILQEVVEKFISDPSDPYVEIEYEVIEPAYIEFLIKARIVYRHQNDVSKIRLRDPRLN